ADEASGREPGACDEGAGQEKEERHRDLHRVGDVGVGSRRDEAPRRVVGEGRAPSALAELLDRREAGQRGEREKLEREAHRPRGAGGEDRDPAAGPPQDVRRQADAEETREYPDLQGRARGQVLVAPRPSGQKLRGQRDDEKGHGLPDEPGLPEDNDRTSGRHEGEVGSRGDRERQADRETRNRRGEGPPPEERPAQQEADRKAEEEAAVRLEPPPSEAAGESVDEAEGRQAPGRREQRRRPLAHRGTSPEPERRR